VNELDERDASGISSDFGNFTLISEVFTVGILISELDEKLCALHGIAQPESLGSICHILITTIQDLARHRESVETSSRSCP